MKAIRIAALVGVVLGLASCSESKKTTEPGQESPYKPLTTISNVIANLKLSCVEENAGEYAKLFHPDYRFFVDSTDVGTLPLSWPLAREVAIAGSMLSGAPNVEGNRVEAIRLGYDEGTPEVDPERQGWQRVTLSAIVLEVDTRNEGTGDPMLYITPAGARAQLYFIRTDEEDPVSHEKIWKIIEWRDRSTGLAKTVENTWGEIKALWTADPMPPYRPLTTIVNVIFNLRTAYIEREYFEYRRLFHSEFTFLGQGDGGPFSWVRADELTSARRMLGGEPNVDGNIVTEIRLAFAEAAPEADPDVPGAQRVVLSAVDLQVDTRHEATGDPTIYITPAGTRENLSLVQTTETDPDSGDPLWKIIRWEEPLGGAGPGTIETNWGIIKSLFH